MGAGAQVLIWKWNDLKTRPIQFKFAGKSVYSLAYCPRKRLLAAGSEDAKIDLWQIPEMQKLFPEKQEQKPLETACWEITKDSAGGNTKLVRSLAFDANGNWLASGGGEGDSLIRVWEVDELIKKLTPKPASLARVMPKTKVQEAPPLKGNR